MTKAPLKKYITIRPGVIDIGQGLPERGRCEGLGREGGVSSTSGVSDSVKLKDRAAERRSEHLIYRNLLPFRDPPAERLYQRFKLLLSYFRS